MSDGEIGTSTEVSRFFRKRKLSCDEANRLTQLVGNMASENIIARLESKIDANAKIHEAHLTAIKWVIAISIAGAGVIAGTIAALSALFLNGNGG